MLRPSLLRSGRWPHQGFGQRGSCGVPRPQGRGSRVCPRAAVWQQWARGRSGTGGVHAGPLTTR
eukprot:8811092-Lingulodinium_polyedra.AAC.1